MERYLALVSANGLKDSERAVNTLNFVQGVGNCQLL
jgi:hypothetical protein